jgi:opacity protein-like surface antigen
MKKYLLALVALSLSASAAFAQGTSKMPENEVLPFTQINHNPVTSAFAGAGSAYNGTAAWSAFSNASILPFYEGTMDMAAGFQMWAPGTSKSTNIGIGTAVRIAPRLAFSVGYALNLYPTDPTFDFAAKHHVIALGVGIGLGESFSIGANARYAVENELPDYSLSGFSGDIFMAYQFNPDFRVTAGVSTLGTSVSAKNGKKYSQPTSAQVAVDWGTHFAQVHALHVMADGAYYFSGHYAVAAGLQYSWNEMVFVRAGYRFASKYSDTSSNEVRECVIPSHLAVGIGAKFAGVHIDLSYLTASKALGNTLNIGLGYSF